MGKARDNLEHEPVMLGVFDQDDPIAPMPGEPAKQYAAFIDYLNMGPGRSVRALARNYKKRVEEGDSTAVTVGVTYVHNWSGQYKWNARCVRMLHLRQREQEALFVDRRMQVREADWEIGQTLRNRVQELLDLLKYFVVSQEGYDVNPLTGKPIKLVTVKFNVTLAQLVKALQTASDLQRTAAGLKDRTYQGSIDMTHLSTAQLERIAQGEDPIVVLATTGRDTAPSETAATN